MGGVEVWRMGGRGGVFFRIGWRGGVEYIWRMGGVEVGVGGAWRFDVLGCGGVILAYGWRGVWRMWCVEVWRMGGVEVACLTIIVSISTGEAIWRMGGVDVVTLRPSLPVPHIGHVYRTVMLLT
jgi:hypothetical protein